MDRIDKVLSKHGFGTRKDVKKLLHSGAVSVNGVPCKAADFHIDMDKDVLEVDGEKLNLRTDVYLMLNKPMDVVCAAKDGQHATVFSCLPDEYMHSFIGGDLHLVGRLDIDTEGLLILTTDGTLTHRLTSPKTHIPKTYRVTLRDPVPAEKQIEYTAMINKGIEIPAEGSEAGFVSQPAEVTWLQEDVCSLVIYEGKYHQVKRMFAALDNYVIALKRTAMGTLQLDPELASGNCRELTEEELSLLKK